MHVDHTTHHLSSTNREHAWAPEMNDAHVCMSEGGGGGLRCL